MQTRVANSTVVPSSRVTYHLSRIARTAIHANQVLWRARVSRRATAADCEARIKHALVCALYRPDAGSEVSGGSDEQVELVGQLKNDSAYWPDIVDVQVGIQVRRSNTGGNNTIDLRSKLIGDRAVQIAI